MKKRRGFTLLETAVTGILLGALMMACVQFSGILATQRRAADARQTAIREAANVMERMAGRTYGELTQKSVQNMDLSEEARQALPDARLEIRVHQTPKIPGAKRITVIVHPEDAARQPVRLVAWKYPPKE